MNRLSAYGRSALRAPIWVTPPMIQTMPLTLKRVSLITRVPSMMGSAAADFIAQPVEDTYYLPQRMLFQRHKLAPAPRGPLSSVKSHIAALTPTGARAVVENVSQLPPGAVSWGDAALARVRFPQPNDTPALWRRPVMGVPQMPAHDRVTAPQALQALDMARQVQATQRARQVAEIRATIAGDVQRQRAGFRRIVGGR